MLVTSRKINKQTCLTLQAILFICIVLLCPTIAVNIAFTNKEFLNIYIYILIVHIVKCKCILSFHDKAVLTKIRK